MEGGGSDTQTLGAGLVYRPNGVRAHFERILIGVDSTKVRIAIEGGDGTLLLERERPDVVLVERELFEADPDSPMLASASRASTPVLVLGAEEDQDFMVRALRSGTRGFLSHDAPASTIKRAAQAVLAGDIWAPRVTLLKAFGHFLGGDFPVYGGAMKDRLTRREQDVVRMVQSGMSDKEIARELGITFKTVKTHLHNIFTKLDIHSRLKLALASLHVDRYSLPG